MVLCEQPVLSSMAQDIAAYLSSALWQAGTLIQSWAKLRSGDPRRAMCRPSRSMTVKDSRPFTMPSTSTAHPCASRQDRPITVCMEALKWLAMVSCAELKVIASHKPKEFTQATGRSHGSSS